MLWLVACSDSFRAVEKDPAPVADTGADGADTATDSADDTGPDDGCASLVDAEREWLAWGVEVARSRDACERTTFPFGGPQGAVIRLEASGYGTNPSLRVTGADGTFVASGTGGALEVALPWAGELFFVVEPEARAAPVAAGITARATCLAGCDAAWTRYPIVLMHGFGGTDAYVDLLDYFYGVREDLTARGYVVATPAVDAFQGVDARASEWVDALEAFAAESHARRFNLVAHSQGGLDARAIVGLEGRSDLVASITTIATPHRGTPLADVVHGAIELSPWDGWLLDQAVAAGAALLGLGEAEFSAQMEDLTTEATTVFNAAVPDDPGVVYRSWSARSCGLLDGACQDETGGEVVDLLLVPTHALIALVGDENDGIVPTTSGVWGEHQGELGADHFDEVGQIADDGTGAFDHGAFYRAEAAALAARGL